VGHQADECERGSSVFLQVMVFLAGFSLQSGIFIVGPLLPEIARDLDLTGTMAGVLVAVPPLLMGLGAIPGGLLTRRLRPALMLGAGLVGIGVAGALRGLAPTWPMVLAMTVLFSGVIGIMQPGGPAFIRERFPTRTGSVTSVYTFGLVCGVIVASGLAGPVLAPLAGGWRGALVAWGALALLTGVLWLLGIRSPSSAAATVVCKGKGQVRDTHASAPWSPWRSRAVWLAAALYAGQGVVFFLLGSWLPAIYAEAGLGPASIGARMMVLAAASLPAILIMPAYADRAGSLRAPLVASAGLTLAGSIGFLIATVPPVFGWLWPLLAGFGVGGILVLVLVLAARVAPSGATGETAAMVLAVGYTMTALGPLLAGVIRDVSGGFRTAMLVPPIVSAAMILLAWAMPDAAGQQPGQSTAR
jgi:MFS transporter, CP family, cyanate transporter